MSKNTIMTTVSRKFGKVGLKVKKHSPEILVTAGIVGTVASAVMACKATTKAGEIIEEKNTQMAQIHEVAKTADPELYSEEDLKKDTVIVYAQTGVKFIKLYGPSVALGALSITAILAGHKILKKRNIALAAAYKTIDKSYKEYRKRIVEHLGEDIDKELKYNLKATEVEETVTDENGKEKKVKQTVNVVDGEPVSSPFSVIFDCGNIGWDRDPERTKFFLVQQQNYANELLQSRGYLFLNEVYDMLGFPKTKSGQIVGWVYDESGTIENNDNYVDFGIFNIHRAASRDFVNGYERAVLLDFNVTGNILEYI